MIPTQQFKALKTESGKWCEWDEECCCWRVTDSPPTLHETIPSEHRILSDIGEPCHIVTVALVDPEYLRMLEKAADILRSEWDGGHKINREIDRLRAEGGT